VPLHSGDELVLSSIPTSESVIAVGRGADLTFNDWLGMPFEKSLEQQGLVTTVAVTNAQVRWVGWDATIVSIPLVSITNVRELAVAHRRTFVLRHAPIERRHHVPAHRFLGFQWGNASAVGPFTESIIRFSRADTDAARVLRDQLHQRGFQWTVEDIPLPADHRDVGRWVVTASTDQRAEHEEDEVYDDAADGEDQPELPRDG
jgi:hypothetical protein